MSDVLLGAPPQTNVLIPLGWDFKIHDTIVVRAEEYLNPHEKKGYACCYKMGDKVGFISRIPGASRDFSLILAIVGNKLRITCFLARVKITKMAPEIQEIAKKAKKVKKTKKTQASA